MTSRILEQNTGSDNFKSLKASTAISELAQGFKIKDVYWITKVSLLLLRTATGGEKIWITIEGDASGYPDGAAVATSGEIALSDLPESGADWVDFTLESEVLLEAYRTYHIVVYGNFGADKYVKVYYDTAALYTDGRAAVYGATAWSVFTGDLSFKVWGYDYATEPLVSLLKVKTMCQISAEETSEDYRLNLAIAGASVAIESYCGRLFRARELTEYYDGKGFDTLFLNQYPVISITGIWDDLDRLFEDSSKMDADSYYLDAENGMVKIIAPQSAVFGTGVFTPGIANVKVVYNAGYSVIPDDLQLAAGILATHYYFLFKDKKLGVLSRSVEAKSIQFNIGRFPPEIMETLEKYRKKGVA